MPDRSPDDDSLVHYWREQLERLRREESRGWGSAAEERTGGEPSPGDGDGDGERGSRGWETAIGALVLLVGVAVAYLVVFGRPSPPGGSPAGDGMDAAPVPAVADTGRDSTEALARAESAAAAPTSSGGEVSSPSPARADAAGETGTPASPEPDTAPADTPELLDLFLGDSATVARAMTADVAPGETGGNSVLVVGPDSPGALWVGVRGGEGRPRAGVELVLEGSARLPGVDERLEVTTDGRGRAVFRFPAVEVRDNVAMEILARGFWLRGTNRVIVRPVP